MRADLPSDNSLADGRWRMEKIPFTLALHLNFVDNCCVSGRAVFSREEDQHSHHEPNGLLMIQMEFGGRSDAGCSESPSRT